MRFSSQSQERRLGSHESGYSNYTEEFVKLYQKQGEDDWEHCYVHVHVGNVFFYDEIFHERLWRTYELSDCRRHYYDCFSDGYQ